MKKTHIGLAATLGMWLLFAATSAWMKKPGLLSYSPEQLMLVRGALCSAIVFLALRGKIWPLRGPVILLAACSGIVGLATYHAFRTWGIAPTVILMTAAPAFNILATWKRSGNIPATVTGCLIVLMAGVLIACWQPAQWNQIGFAWTLLATVSYAALCELIALSQETPAEIRFFWSTAGIVLVNGILVALAGKPIHITGELVGFGLVAGLGYWGCMVISLLMLEKDTAATLQQGETPAAIVAALIFLGERLSTIQIGGLGLAMASLLYLIGTTKEEEKI